MKQDIRLKTAKKVIHAPSKSQQDDEYLTLLSEEALSTVESPKCSRQSPKYKKCKKTQLAVNQSPVTVSDVLKQEQTSKVQKGKFFFHSPENSGNKVKEQKKMIKLQEDLIINLKKEIGVLKNDKSFNKPETDTVESLKNETMMLESKISNIKQAYEKDLKTAKQQLALKETQIKEQKFEFYVKLQSKDQKIEKLEQKLQKLNKNSKEIQKKIQDLDEVKLSYSKEKSEKNKLIELNEEISNQLKIVTEENKLLIQNYSKIQSDYKELETKFHSLRVLNAKTTNTQVEITNLIEQFENINKQNKILNEKLRLMSERTVLAESENADMRSALLKAEKTVASLKKKLNKGQFNNLSQHWTGLKTLNDFEYLNVPTKLSCETGDFSLSGGSIAESQITQIEHELNTVKELNCKLKVKEGELNEKLLRNKKSQGFSKGLLFNKDLKGSYEFDKSKF